MLRSGQLPLRSGFTDVQQPCLCECAFKLVFTLGWAEDIFDKFRNLFVKGIRNQHSLRCAMSLYDHLVTPIADLIEQFGQLPP